MDDMFHNPMEEQAYQLLLETPFYFTHAQNDKIDPVIHSDALVKKLCELGADVFYARYKKGGHLKFFNFCRKSNWVDWMFEKSRNEQLP